MSAKSGKAAAGAQQGRKSPEIGSREVSGAISAVGSGAERAGSSPQTEQTRPFANEDAFRDALVHQLLFRGFRVFHPLKVKDHRGYHRTAFKGSQGYPDLTFVGHGLLVLTELKFDTKSRYRPGQKEWLAELAAASVDPAPRLWTGVLYAADYDPWLDWIDKSVRAGHFMRDYREG